MSHEHLFASDTAVGFASTESIETTNISTHSIGVHAKQCDCRSTSTVIFQNLFWFRDIHQSFKTNSALIFRVLFGAVQSMHIQTLKSCTFTKV